MWDYSGYPTRPRPHDLVWADTAAVAGPRPGWADRVLASGAPTVVRRAPCQDGCLPVGIRGAHRGQRCPAWLIERRVGARRTPESIAAAAGWIAQPRTIAVPALRALSAVAAVLDAGGWRWGVTGAIGYELATGRAVGHADSDLDLLLRVPRPLPRAAARRLAQTLAALPARCDAQLETPAGGMALADWASAAERVLVKSDHGPFLSADPWADSWAAAPRRDGQSPSPASI